MTTYIIAVSIAIPIFISLIIIESLIAYKNKLIINKSEDTISSLSSGITNTIRDATKFGVLIISYNYLYEHFAIINVIPIWLAVILAFLIQDFAGYWIHRLNHRVNIFWNRHIIHHSSEEFNLSCALRQSISNNLKFGAIFLFPAAILGIPPSLFAIITPVHLFMQFWYHTQLIDKMGWLEKILVTPSHHRVHHAINPEYIDKNYSQIFIIWDKLFGTFQLENKSITPIYGVLHPVKTWNPIIINFKHLWLMIKDAYYTHNFIDKMKIWFMPTGWRPKDVKYNYPIKIINNPFTYKKYNPKNLSSKLYWSWFQLLISGICMFVIFYSIKFMPLFIISLFIIILFIHIMSYTFLLDNNNLAISCELVKILTSMFLLYIIYNYGFSLPYFIYMIIFVYCIISLLVTIYFSKNKLHNQLI